MRGLRHVLKILKLLNQSCGILLKRCLGLAQVKKLQAPQKQLELARKPKKAVTPNTAKPVRAPKKPKQGGSSQGAEDTLRLKVTNADPL